MAKLSSKLAAIAQPVERILGKDEVASSNLASSSKKKPRTPTGFRLSSFLHCMLPIPKTDTETDTGCILPSAIRTAMLPIITAPSPNLGMVLSLLSSFVDHATGDFLSGVASGLGMEIIRVTVNDYGSSDNILYGEPIRPD